MAAENSINTGLPGVPCVRRQAKVDPPTSRTSRAARVPTPGGSSVREAQRVSTSCRRTASSRSEPGSQASAPQPVRSSRCSAARLPRECGSDCSASQPAWCAPIVSVARERGFAAEEHADYPEVVLDAMNGVELMSSLTLASNALASGSGGRKQGVLRARLQSRAQRSEGRAATCQCERQEMRRPEPYILRQLRELSASREIQHGHLRGPAPQRGLAAPAPGTWYPPALCPRLLFADATSPSATPLVGIPRSRFVE